MVLALERSYKLWSRGVDLGESKTIRLELLLLFIAGIEIEKINGFADVLSDPGSKSNKTVFHYYFYVLIP